nr:N-formimino-L-glutamate deiminase [Candidatus Pantoea persica]
MAPCASLSGVTLWGAKALGLEKTHGSLEAGKVANLVHWPLARPAERFTGWVASCPVPLSSRRCAMTPFHFTPGSLPLLVSIPHAGTQLTPEVEAGLSEAARGLPDID